MRIRFLHPPPLDVRANGRTYRLDILFPNGSGTARVMATGPDGEGWVICQDLPKEAFPAAWNEGFEVTEGLVPRAIAGTVVAAGMAFAERRYRDFLMLPG